jgi:hypothetical protein
LGKDKQDLLEQVALLGRERPLLHEPIQQLRTRPPEDALEQVAQEPPGDVLVRPDRLVAERPLVVDLAEESLVGQGPHKIGDRRVGPIQPRFREAVAGLRRGRLAVPPEGMHDLEFPFREVFRRRASHDRPSSARFDIPNLIFTI